FGQTEVPNFATKLSKADHLNEKFLSSCGQPIITSDVRIGDENSEPLPFGEVGEIMARSPYTLGSYYNDPEKTAEVYAGEWVLTGDVGYQVDTGHVFIVDRSKDMIISGRHRQQTQRRLRRGPSQPTAINISQPALHPGRRHSAVLCATDLPAS
ncbi:MAG: hypothetical protein COB82_08300, partial [Marinobacter sp.]